MTEAQYRYEERAAIMEFDGGETRERAEEYAKAETALVMFRINKEKKNWSGVKRRQLRS